MAGECNSFIPNNRQWDVPDHGPVLREHVPWDEEIKKIMTSVMEYSSALKDKADFNLLKIVKNQFADSLEKFSRRQDVILNQIKTIQNQINSKITMENLKTGFSKTVVTKEENTAPAGMASASTENVQVFETIHDPKSISAAAQLSSDEVYDISPDDIMTDFAATDEDLLNCHPQLLNLSNTRDFTKMVI